jgi:transcriptional regulator with XRE-family HTH domain
VQTILEKELGSFLRKMRGQTTFRQFSRKIGLPPSTLYRLEMGYQSITLRRLQQIMSRLDCTLKDVFPRQTLEKGKKELGPTNKDEA